MYIYIINVHKWLPQGMKHPQQTRSHAPHVARPFDRPCRFAPRDPGVRHPGHAEPGTHILHNNTAIISNYKDLWKL